MKATKAAELNQLEPLLVAWGRWAGEIVTKQLGYRTNNVVPLHQREPQGQDVFLWHDGCPITEQDIETMEQVICILSTHQPTLADILLNEYTHSPTYSSQRSRAAKIGLSVTEYRRRLNQAQQWVCGYFAGYANE